jgi:hypothetical protein
LSDHGERKAGVDTTAIEQNRAGTTLAVVTTLLAPGKVEVFTQKIEEGGAGVYRKGVGLLVDGERDGEQRWLVGSSPGRLRHNGRWKTGGNASGDERRGCEELTAIELDIRLRGWFVLDEIGGFGAWGQVFVSVDGEADAARFF